MSKSRTHGSNRRFDEKCPNIDTTVAAAHEMGRRPENGGFSSSKNVYFKCLSLNTKPLPSACQRSTVDYGHWIHRIVLPRSRTLHGPAERGPRASEWQLQRSQQHRRGLQNRLHQQNKLRLRLGSLGHSASCPESSRALGVREAAASQQIRGAKFAKTASANTVQQLWWPATLGPRIPPQSAHTPNDAEPPSQVEQLGPGLQRDHAKGAAQHATDDLATRQGGRTDFLAVGQSGRNVTRRRKHSQCQHTHGGRHPLDPAHRNVERRPGNVGAHEARNVRASETPQTELGRDHASGREEMGPRIEQPKNGQAIYIFHHFYYTFIKYVCSHNTKLFLVFCCSKK
jgi:hypothetical protein